MRRILALLLLMVALWPPARLLADISALVYRHVAASGGAESGGAESASRPDRIP